MMDGVNVVYCEDVEYLSAHSALFYCPVRIKRQKHPLGDMAAVWLGWPEL